MSPLEGSFIPDLPRRPLPVGLAVPVDFKDSFTEWKPVFLAPHFDFEAGMPAGEATAFEVDIVRLRLVTFGFPPTGAQTGENFCITYCYH